MELNRRIGDNALSERKGKPWFVKLIGEMTGFFALLLWVAAILCVVAYYIDPAKDPSNLYLGIVLAAVVVVTGIFSYFQNEKSENIMASFKNFIPQKSKVLRNGAWTQIDAVKLVPGDIVEVKGGDRVPADIRIIFSNEMKVDNSSLTGESDLLLRTTECSCPENPLETKNLAFFGTMCKEGLGKGLVIQIGDATVIGQIANLAATAGSVETPLRKEINSFIKFISKLSFAFGVLFFVLGFIVGYPFITNVIFGIGIIVANVPEGLIAIVTLTLTITAKKLAKKKVLVKNLEAVETLGSTSCICSDKTGTLTQAKMTVRHLWYDGKILKGENKQKFSQKHVYEYDTESLGFKTLQEVALVCSEATFNNAAPQEKLEKIMQIRDPSKREALKKKIEEDYARELEEKLWLDRPTIGDASETALIKFFQPIEDIVEYREKYNTTRLPDGAEAKVPFNSSLKYALKICTIPSNDSEYCVYIKGAPEKIWTFCSHIYVNGEVQRIDEKWQLEFNNANLSFGKQGERVLGFAKIHLPKERFPQNFEFCVKSHEHYNFPVDSFVFAGLISIVDPPRDAVPFSVKKCKAAGVKVIMVTGDQPVTATAIARQVNIITAPKTVNEIAEEEGMSFEQALQRSEAIVIHGNMLNEAMVEDDTLPEEQRGLKLASWLSKGQIVFARTSPAQKLMIVEGCQKLGHIVAVTGDGVNDSPAIKKADIGIAMGITGSDVAKDAADMILTSDDFSAIVTGIEEGRRLFDNLKKAICYCLTSNTPEILPFITFILLQVPLPLSTILVLCIDLGTDLMPSLGFPFEIGELDLMTRKPRGKNDHLFCLALLMHTYFQKGIFMTFGAFLSYITCLYQWGYRVDELIGMGLASGFPHNNGDVYDPDHPTLGNTAVSCNGDTLVKIDNPSEEANMPDWIFAGSIHQDLRMFFLKCTGGRIEATYRWGDCLVRQLSPFSGKAVCYTTEGLKYAQTSFFFSIVCGQIVNTFCCKTIKLSVLYQGVANMNLIWGIAFEVTLCFCLAYLYPCNVSFGSRDVTFLHFGMPALLFEMSILIYDEIRKYLLRNWTGTPENPSWFVKWNTW
eukprot:TRINITY_DN1855_c0_g1_i8.p1 TRINITY_DN1855_c0_g1~~TRINITY_DN1855_c0_g1_i8.p1  ORF type:complete len:1079 (-),score=209.38 TRINITY_DN1855_c0_g1_i8:252-3488(-)